VVVPPPGVLESPVGNSAAISYPAMQMQHAEPLACRLEENSLSVAPEPAFRVVVKNTFIDIVETSPKSIHRSRSEPPRFMNRDLEKRPRCSTTAEDMTESFAEQQGPELVCLPDATLETATKMESSEVSPCTSQPQHFIQDHIIEDSSTEVKTFRGEESFAFSDMAVPAFEVRNTFIEVCQGLPKLQSLRSVRSDADLLALEREAIH